MIWNIFRRRTTVPSLMSFLDEADEALIIAYEKKDTRAFGAYADPRLIYYLSESIIENKRLFGIKAYRIRNWEITSQSDTEVRVVKRLTHQHVKLSKQISMAIGDDITETWWISLTSGKPRVSKIKEGVH